MLKVMGYRGLDDTGASFHVSLVCVSIYANFTGEALESNGLERDLVE